MNFNLKPFERRMEKGLIRRQTKGELIILNYTQEAQWSKSWDKYVKMARGLILTKEGTVVARPFPKFFNLEEQFPSLKGLPTEQPEVSEKLDGSLGILYQDQDDKEIGDIAIATRGSFESEQAVWATKWIREHRPKAPLLENTTYLYEIIYPGNRIVVNYKQRAELVLIGLVHNFTGKISRYNDVITEAGRQGWNCAAKFNLSIDEIQAKAKTDNGLEEEGYVLFYPEQNLQLKVKLSDYVRLHRLTFGITVKSIWENMMFGQDPETIFSDAPDEVMDWIKMWSNHFNKQYISHLDEVMKHLDKIKMLPERRDQALYLKEKAPEYLPAVFSLLDKGTCREYLFKRIRPSKENSNESFRVIKEDEA